MKIGLDVVHGGLGLVPEEGVHGHDDAGGAEAALRPVRCGHALLNGVQLGPEQNMFLNYNAFLLFLLKFMSNGLKQFLKNVFP